MASIHERGVVVQQAPRGAFYSSRHLNPQLSASQRKAKRKTYTAGNSVLAKTVLFALHLAIGITFTHAAILRHPFERVFFGEIFGMH